MNEGGRDAAPRIAVIGGGTMGSGIAQVVATAGIDCVLVERSDADVARATSTITRHLRRLVEKGELDQASADAASARITGATDVAAITGAGMVIEAVFEDPAVKQELIRRASPHVDGKAIFATNTSSISVTALAAETPDPTRFAGMHFFNPVPRMKLVEVVRGLQTSSETIEAIRALAVRLGKTPVVVNDAPGFVANRVVAPMINEAIFCLAEGVATKEAIDDVMKLGMAHPMGPLALADLVGLDVLLGILEVLHTQLGEDKYRPAPLLRRYVAAGKLGRKSGEGFYVYETRP